MNKSKGISKLIIITGPPGVGKTTFARKICEIRQIPMISKDDIKERLFESLGWSDREWSKKLGLTSFVLLYYFMETSLSNGYSIIVEANFDSNIDKEKILILKQKYDFNIVQFYCWASSEISYERFKNRVKTGERHPGHVDRQDFASYQKAWFNGREYELGLDGKLIKVDMSDFSKVNYNQLNELI